MVNQQLVDYAKNYLQQGYSEAQIAQVLRGSGYPDEMIRETFNEVRMQSNYHSYPQQYQQPSYHEEHINDHHHANKKIFIFIGILLGIMLIAGAVIYFTVVMGPTTPEDDINYTIYTTTSSTTTTTLPGEGPAEGETIQLFETLLCNDIDEQFNCFENRYDEFERGESVFIYFKLFLDSKAMSGTHKIGFTEDRRVIGPNGEEVAILSYDYVMDITREVPEEGTYSIPVFNEIITTESDPAGEYRVIFTIKDRYTDYQMEFEKTYILI